jgi:hypothetical protein
MVKRLSVISHKPCIHLIFASYDMDYYLQELTQELMDSQSRLEYLKEIMRLFIFLILRIMKLFTIGETKLVHFFKVCNHRINFSNFF